MALISYGIQLTSKAINAGPDFAVEYSTDCVNYTFAGRVTLQNTASIDYVDIEETSTCIKLESVGNCTNYVVSGSSPSTSSYNTHLVTLTQKNGAGPEFIVSENTSSLFTYLDTIELASQGATATIEPDPQADAIRLRSNGVCTTSETVIINPVVTPTPTPAPTPEVIYSYGSTRISGTVSVTYVDPYDVQRSFSHNSSISRQFVGKSIVSNTNSTIISQSNAIPNTILDSSSLDPFNQQNIIVSASGIYTYGYWLSGSEAVPQVESIYDVVGEKAFLNDCIVSGSIMMPNFNPSSVYIETGSACGTPPPTPPPTAAPGQLYSFKQTAVTYPVSVTYTDAFGNTQSFSHSSGIPRYFVGRNIQSSTNATIISQSNATPGNLIDSGGLDYAYSYNYTVEDTDTTSDKLSYITYVDETGQYYVREVSNLFGTNTKVVDCMASHSLMIPNFTEVTSDVTFTKGTYCGIPTTPTPVPTATPVPTPAPTPANCYTFYTIYGSVNSATDACCNQFNTKPVFLDASSLATATTVYATNDCSTIRTTPTYYTQNLYDYYYWTGASLVGPTSCPGCP